MSAQQMPNKKKQGSLHNWLSSFEFDEDGAKKSTTSKPVEAGPSENQKKEGADTPPPLNEEAPDIVELPVDERRGPRTFFFDFANKNRTQPPLPPLEEEQLKEKKKRRSPEDRVNRFKKKKRQEESDEEEDQEGKEKATNSPYFTTAALLLGTAPLAASSKPSVVRQPSDYGKNTGKSLGGKRVVSGVPGCSQFKPPVRSASSSCADDDVSSTQEVVPLPERLKVLEPRLLEIVQSEIIVQNLTTNWEDVSGLEAAKSALKEIVIWPFLRPEIFKGIRAPAKGVLLFGPPGTGKTMIGKCVASQCEATFFNISASSLTSKWVGEGEKLVRALFAVARVRLPSVIFIDEVDSLLSSRSESEHESSRRIKTEFLVQMDGLDTDQDERLLVLGATNRPQELDEAARRRFSKRLYVPLPDSDARGHMAVQHLTNQTHSLSSQDFQKVADLTDGFSGSDVRSLCREAAMGPVRQSLQDNASVSLDQIPPISLGDFENALRVVRPTVAQQDLSSYVRWNELYGEH